MADTSSSDSSPGSPGEAVFMGVVLLFMFGCLFIGWKTPETVVFMCLVLVWNVGLVGTTEALSGFSNAGMLAVGALFVVIKGVEKSQLADKAARRVFGLQTTLRAGLARMMSLCFVLSAFLNNTPVVALLIPITRDWARARGFSPSIFLIPLSYSCIMGGLLTVIGTSTNLVVQGLVLDEAKTDSSIEAVGFFEPGYVGVPLGVVGMVYLVFVAPRVLPSSGGLFRYIRDRAKELLTEVMNDFPHIGEPAGLVLARLGLPQDTLIKIRRKISHGILRQMSMSLEEHALVGMPSRTQIVSNGAGDLGANVSAIMEANQKTFKADSMFSYRMKAQGLWGESQCGGEPLEHAASTTVAGGSAAEEGVSRKRWASDADATNITGQEFQRPKQGNNGAAATVNGNGATVVQGGGSLGDGNAETYTDIYPVSAAEPIQAGDVLFMSCAQATMIDFQAGAVSQGLKGLKFLDVNALDLPGHGTEFFEIVLSGHNHFVGRSAGRDNSAFAAYYGCSVVAVRRRGSSEATNTSVSAPPVASRVNSTAGQGHGSARTGSNVLSPVHDAPEVRLEEGIIMSAERAFDPEGEEEAEKAAPPVSASPAPKTLTRRSAAVSSAADPVRSPVTASLSGTTPTGRVPRSPRSPERLWRTETNSKAAAAAGSQNEEVTESSFKAGDVVLVLAKEEFIEKFSSSKDFFLVTKVGSVPTPVRYFDYLPLVAFLGMLIWVLFDADMVQAAFAAGAILIFGGWVDAKKTVGYVDWSLLLLIGSALGLSKGIVNSGLANYVGGAIRDSGISPEGSLFVLYAFTMICTELITNNAAAALATPIAFSISRELEVSYKPFVLTVMLAASSSFITPIGYQTNTLVWGPGGYKFTDFMKIGTPLSLIYLVLGCLLVPQVFPF